jgi:hypothetical protein
MKTLVIAQRTGKNATTLSHNTTLNQSLYGPESIVFIKISIYGCRNHFLKASA